MTKNLYKVENESLRTQMTEHTTKYGPSHLSTHGVPLSASFMGKPLSSTEMLVQMGEEGIYLNSAYSSWLQEFVGPAVHLKDRVIIVI